MGIGLYKEERKQHLNSYTSQDCLADRCFPLQGPRAQQRRDYMSKLYIIQDRAVKIGFDSSSTDSLADPCVTR